MLLKNKPFISSGSARFLCGALLSFSSGLALAADAGNVTEEPFTLGKAVKIALQQDAWQVQNRLQEKALISQSQAAGELPDPQFSFAVANLPTDSFKLDQEPMTQLIAGVSQMLPRGDSLVLRKQQFLQQSERHPLLSLDRQARLVMTVSQLWLEAYKVRQSIALIRNDRVLFDQLVDISLASYSAALGQTQQQDVVRAELEKTLLDERLNGLLQRQESLEQQLDEWLQADHLTVGLSYSQDMPRLSLLQPELDEAGSNQDNAALGKLFLEHPLVKALNKKLAMQQTGVDLAKQAYEPQWGVRASYGYRSSDSSGADRADLVTFGVTLDMPVFSTVKQDSGVDAAVYRREAVKSERILLLRKMIAEYSAARVQRERLEEREARYRHQILPQMRLQAQAALNAYTADNGDFAEVVRARIAELNGRIDALELAVDQQILTARMNYFLATEHLPVLMVFDSTGASSLTTLTGSDSDLSMTYSAASVGGVKL
ncbi:TolC family protein [Aliamphritea spongicola]|uniref:TolC family protein n=1 Tax=Aliamphritea spongicola TaxID=707589 RepID=UPI00196BA468|nr:TolC family protein [Aliamphritea spongicola]MBN3562707.1 TolC family protein [Aliamphritea spongicola]